MTDMPWNIRAENFIKRHINLDTGEIFDSAFRERVDILRKSPDSIDDTEYPAYLHPSPLTQLMTAYGLPPEMKDMMRHFILTGKVDTSRAKPPLAIIDESDGTYRLNISSIDEEEFWESYSDTDELKIVISPHATPTEIRNFVLENSDFIKAKQKKRGTKSIRVRPQAERNHRYIKKRELGMQFKDIAEDELIPTSYSEVRISHDREKKRQNKNNK